MNTAIEVRITPSENPLHKSGFQEPSLPYTYDEEGLPVYSTNKKYFSAWHSSPNTMSDSQYIHDFLGYKPKEEMRNVRH